MRVLNVIQHYFPARGGTEDYVRNIFERLVLRGHNISVLASDIIQMLPPKKAKISSLVINGVHVQRIKTLYLRLMKEKRDGIEPSKTGIISQIIPFLDRKKSLALPMLVLRAFSYPFYPQLIYKLMEYADEFDILNGWHFPWPAPLQAFIAAKIKRVPFIICPLFHIGRPMYECESLYYTLKKADGVIALTPFEKKYFTLLGVPKHKISVVSPGLDINKFSNSKAKEKWKKDNFVILFIGRREFDKGYHHLIISMELVWRKIPNCVLMIVGPKSSFKAQLMENQNYLKTLSMSNAILSKYKDKIVDLGSPLDEVKNEALASADLLVVPSRVESFGIVYLEAWANKKPIICARIGPTTSFVEDGKDGFLVTFGDIHNLARKIIKLLLNHKLRETMGNSGYQKVIKNFTWDKQVNKLEAFYEKVYEQHRKGR